MIKARISSTRVLLGGGAALVVTAVLGAGGGMAASDETPAGAQDAASSTLPKCDPDNGGLKLPDGFCALVVADNLGRTRYLAVSPSGDAFARLRSDDDGAKGGVVALRDRDGDGRADEQEWFAKDFGTGIRFHDGYLYVSTDDAVMRYQMAKGQLTPAGEPETIVSGLVDRGQHAAKSFTFDDSGNMYVDIGAPSNACQPKDRATEAPGERPCQLLEEAGGVWRFSADRPGQTQQSGHRYSTGLRNALALAWNPEVKAVYAVPHGRDSLDTLWPDLFTAEQNAHRTAEEFHRLEDGGDYGWPYCYYDAVDNRRVLAPEYGGDGKTMGECDKYPEPLVAFPAHWGPNDLLFYTGDQFPERYRNGAFVAFHGSWNRAPLPQAGYLVAFVPMKDGKPTGTFEVFADGFTGKEEIKSPGDAAHRPTGLAVGPDGSLYIADDVKGRIWRVVYEG